MENLSHAKFGAQSFESILNEKIKQICDVEDDVSSICCTVTKNGHGYSGILIIDSSLGKLFATAGAQEVKNVANSLCDQITSQIRRIKVTPVMTLNAI